MRGHWGQVGQHATCLKKSNKILNSKNQNSPHQQAQHNDLIDFQILISA
jgi:hypothetical protein